jgi:hypothetical protein
MPHLTRVAPVLPVFPHLVGGILSDSYKRGNGSGTWTALSSDPPVVRSPSVLSSWCSTGPQRILLARVQPDPPLF